MINRVLARRATYQGVCHECQRGYYWPTKPGLDVKDPKNLACARCGHSPANEKVKS